MKKKTMMKVKQYFSAILKQIFNFFELGVKSGKWGMVNIISDVIWASSYL